MVIWRNAKLSDGFNEMKGKAQLESKFPNNHDNGRLQYVVFFSPIFRCLSCNSLLQIDGFSLLRGIHMNTKSGEPSEAHPDYRTHVCSVCAHSVVSDAEIPWTAACQALLSTGFSRQESWKEASFPTSGDLPDLGTEPPSLASPALTGSFFTTNATHGTHEPEAKDSPLRYY